MISDYWKAQSATGKILNDDPEPDPRPSQPVSADEGSDPITFSTVGLNDRHRAGSCGVHL